MAHHTEFMPDPDEYVTEHTLVAADTARTYAAIGRAEASGDRVLGLLGGLADLPDRMAGAEVQPKSLGELLGPELGFVVLSDEPGSGRTVGLALRYSAFERGIERLDRERFASFAEPGHLKLVVEFELQPQADGRTLLGCGFRVRATDDDTRSTLRTTWFAVGAGLGLLARRLLELIRTEAESGSGPERAEHRDADGDHA